MKWYECGKKECQEHDSCRHSRASAEITAKHVAGKWCGSNYCSTCSQLKFHKRALKHVLGEQKCGRKCELCYRKKTVSYTGVLDSEQWYAKNAIDFITREKKKIKESGY